MKKIIFTGVLALTAGLTGLLAQQAAPAAAPQAAPPAAAKGPTVKSQAEGQAVMAVQGAAADPDATIKAAEDLLTKYADTEFKEFALSMEARAYQQKGDDANAQVYGERVLAINPKAYLMEMLVGEVLAKNIKEHDLDRDEKVAKANKLLHDAIEGAKTAPKPNPQIPDADWAAASKYTVAECYNGLGMVNNTIKNRDEAIKDFQLALDNDPEQDAYATRLAAAYLGAGKKAEAIALCDKLLAKPNLHPQIKTVVTSIKTDASK